MGWPENLGWVREVLDRYANVMVEFGGREAELGRQPRAARELFLKYQDRVMFGSDNGMDAAMYRNYFRWLETADDSFDYWGAPSQGRWEIYGLDLPDAVLEKIYHGNAEKLFSAISRYAGEEGDTMKSESGRKLGWLAGLVVVGLFAIGIVHKPAMRASGAEPGHSAIQVEADAKGPIILTTKTAEFRILPSGYVQASLIENGRKLTLDDPAVSEAAGDFIVLSGKPVHFSLDFAHAKIEEASGKMGAGKRIEIPGEALALTAGKVQRILTIEVYDDFPNLLLSSAEYRNAGNADLHIEQLESQHHRFNAHLADAKAQPYEMWAFQGSSYDWGKDDVQKLKSPIFSAERNGRRG